MNVQKVIRDKKKIILIILALIVVVALCAGGFHLHAQSVKKQNAEKQVDTVIADLQDGKMTKAETLLGRKPSKTLNTDQMSADAYMKTIVQALGYTTGDETKDASSSYTDLLQAGGADDTMMENMKKLDQAFQKNCITSYEITGTELKGNTVTVSVDVKGIILLPKVSFLNDVQKANKKLADYVNDHMDDLMNSYTQAGDQGDSTINTALKKQEMDELIPAMTRRVNKAEKSEETWTFTVDVSSDQAKIQNVSVSH